MNYKAKILIIEDMEVQRFLLKQALLSFRIIVDEAENGKIALEKLVQNRDYDGIITDVDMPVMNGIEATKKIRKLGFKNPIIGFSSMSEDEDIAKGLNAGMDAYLKKTADYDVIRKMLEDLDILEKEEEEEEIPI
ncbi:MAG: response regulator [Bacteroidota bacterium]